MNEIEKLSEMATIQNKKWKIIEFVVDDVLYCTLDVNKICHYFL